MTKYREYSVWRLNDCEWWAGITFEDTVQTAMETADMDRDDILDESYESKPVDLKKIKIWECDLSEIPKDNKIKLFFYKLLYLRSYLHFLKWNLKTQGHKGEAFYFCGTEY